MKPPFGQLVFRRIAILSTGAVIAVTGLAGCGDETSAGSSAEAVERVPNQLDFTLNGEQVSYAGMAMKNQYGKANLELWNVENAPVFNVADAEKDPEKAAGGIIGGIMDGNQLKISLVGVDLPKAPLPYKISGSDEGINAMSTPRATLQLTHNKKNYYGGVAMVPNIPRDWELVIENIDGEMLHGRFEAKLVNMYDGDDLIELANGKFAIRVKGLAGE